jgi:hypothetical protein
MKGLTLFKMTVVRAPKALPSLRYAKNDSLWIDSGHPSFYRPSYFFRPPSKYKCALSSGRSWHRLVSLVGQRASGLPWAMACTMPNNSETRGTKQCSRYNRLPTAQLKQVMLFFSRFCYIQHKTCTCFHASAMSACCGGMLT